MTAASTIQTALLPILMVGMWLFGNFIASRMSGWHRLAEKYTTDETFPDNTRGFQFGGFGWTHYKGCLWVGCNQKGLYLKTGPFFLFAFQHPPLCIPWSAFSRIEQDQNYFKKMIKFSVIDPKMSISIDQGSFRDSMNYLYETNLLKRQL
jgi:hypothetical protein